MKKKNLTDEIIELLKSVNKPLQLNEISVTLKIKSDSEEYQILKFTLNDMCFQGVLDKSSRRKYSLKDYDDFSTVTGVLRYDEDRGIVTGKFKNFTKVIVKRRHLYTALDGDTVKVKLLAFKINKKPRGVIVDVVERHNAYITGTIEFDGSFYFLIPEESKFYVDFLIPPDKLNGAKGGDKVAAEFLSWDDPLKSPQAKVTEILGKAGVPVTEFEAIIKEFGLPKTFPDLVNTETESIDSKISQSIIDSRQDFRKDEIITIDPDDAKDFDDALSLKLLENGNWLLGVHIADVSHYVIEATAIDKEAVKRGTSTYLVDRVVPMLPEALSNELCSLKPNRIRLTFSVMMELTPTGITKNYQIAESVIKSKKRFTYGEVQKIIETGTGEHSELILNLHKLAEILKAKRFKGGGINFETVEIKFELDENKQPLRAVQKTTTPATSLVEECMLAANKTVAEHIKKISKSKKLKEMLPFLYRVHDEPLPEKLKSVLDFIKLYGHESISAKSTSKSINNLLEQFEDRPEKPIVHQMLVRAMPKAEYSATNIGHFGLGFSDYSHFTSPIRRYPDLIVHRILKQYASALPDQIQSGKLKKRLEALGEHCTQKERDAMEAERASTKIAQSILASKFVGKEFEGTISGITNFGIFVVLDNIYAEGLVHIRDLKDDYYVFDEKYVRLVGRRSKKIFHFGMRIKVLITNVNTDKRKVELKLVDDNKTEIRKLKRK